MFKKFQKNIDRKCDLINNAYARALYNTKKLYITRDENPTLNTKSAVRSQNPKHEVRSQKALSPSSEWGA